MPEYPTPEFYSVYPRSPMPTPASDDWLGLMPARAAQLCTPLKAGSAHGYYAYPPVDFGLRWDGRTTEITWLDRKGEPTTWASLAGGREVYLPQASQSLENIPPDRAAQIESVMSPRLGTPFINAHPRSQQDCEITSGLIARTPSGWGLMVRGVANMPGTPGVEVFDGFLETDWYRSFVPFVIRITAPNAIVRFFRNIPLAQLQPMPIVAPRSAAAIDTGTENRGIANWPDDVWSEFVKTRSQRRDPDRQRGTYARTSIKAERTGRCPYGAATEGHNA